MTDVLQVCKELLSRESITPNDGGCLEYLINFLGNDFKVEWLNFADTKNVIISHGSPGPELMFLGHVDVVPPGDYSKWASHPFKPSERDGRIYARGACDMKSGVAAMACAVKNFVAKHKDHKGLVSLLLTSDEEGDNFNAIPKVVEEFKRSNRKIDYCIVGEPSSKEKLADTIKIGRRGTLSGELVIEGIQGHVAYPYLADNPIHKFAPVLTELTQHIWDNGNEYFEPTSLQFSNINAGTGAGNVIPGELKTSFNFRYSTLHKPEDLISRFEEILNRAKLKYKISWLSGGAPFITNSGRLIEACSQAIQAQFGYTPKQDTSGGTSDARFIAPLGTEVIELGVRGESLHKIDEFVRIEDLQPLADLYEYIAFSLLIK